MKLHMLKEFICRQNVDVIFLQQVATEDVDQIRGYTSYYNISTAMQGIAIVARNTLQMTKIPAILSVRAMTANLGDLRLINIYAPSGTARKAERETFFNNELTYVLRRATGTVLMRGDFNCTMEPGATTERVQPSRALANLLNGLGLQDAW
jgi:exonuclease III